MQKGSGARVSCSDNLNPFCGQATRQFACCLLAQLLLQRVNVAHNVSCDEEGHLQSRRKLVTCFVAQKTPSSTRIECEDLLAERGLISS